MKALSVVHGFSAAMAGAPLAYALTEWFERRSGPVDDPAGILWVDHSSFLGRLTVVVFVVGLSTVSASALDARWPGRMPVMFASLAVLSTLATLGIAATLR